MTPVYRAAERLVEVALRSSDSLFTPGRAIWTLDHLRQFHRLFVDQEDLSKDSFNVKMQRQLKGASPEVAQLAAELLFFHSLGVSNQGPVSKRAMIDPLLQMAGVRFPDDLEAALQDGVAHHGIGLAHRDAYIRLLCRFMLAWKELEAARQDQLLADPWAFRELVVGLPAGADAAQRNMLLHLVFPDYFEDIASPYDKERIAECFGDFVSDPGAGVDRKLVDIREALSGKYGDGFTFYQDDLRRQWGTVKGSAAGPGPDPSAAIAQMMESMYPDTDLRQSVLQLAADAVVAAHEAGPRSWGLGADAKYTYLGLNVGRLATVALHPDRVLVSLDDRALDDTMLSQLREASAKPPGAFTSLATSRYWHLRPDTVSYLGEQIRPALVRHIAAAAAAVSVTPYARYHMQEACRYLTEATGVQLPRPSYPEAASGAEPTGWDGFVYWAARMFDEERFDDWERDYKLAISERLRQARDALRSGSENWLQLLKTAFTRQNNLTPWQQHDKFLKWAKDDPDIAKQALTVIWEESAPVADRIRGFCRLVPREKLPGAGMRLAIASFLLMVNPAETPIFRPTPFRDAWQLTLSAGPAADADEADTYLAALAFMDELKTRLGTAGVQLRDRLDAQALIWAVVHWDEPPQFLTPEEREALLRYKAGITKPGEPPPTQPVSVSTKEPHVVTEESGWVEPAFPDIVAAFTETGFRITAETLMRYHLSLKTRGFVIISGVSGTGKSWLARLYAQVVGGKFCLVSVAPNWNTNEDLLGFHNPVTGRYIDTDFSRFLREAIAEQRRATDAGKTPRPYYVLLDEMNLARVEYYFAKFLSVMEARGQEGVFVELSETERLPLPPNLYAVGTVNVDETTHGFADKVYDRAQVIELTISGSEVSEFAGAAEWSALLLEVWNAVKPVAPFAYRVVDEVRRYVVAAANLGVSWTEALDHQVLQKVLPKLARADERVGTALAALREVCGATLPLSAAKAASMLRNLEEHGFASYF